jgi:hypothetical protein
VAIRTEILKNHDALMAAKSRRALGVASQPPEDPPPQYMTPTGPLSPSSSPRRAGPEGGEPGIHIQRVKHGVVVEASVEVAKGAKPKPSPDRHASPARVRDKPPEEALSPVVTKRKGSHDMNVSPRKKKDAPGVVLKERATIQGVYCSVTMRQRVRAALGRGRAMLGGFGVGRLWLDSCV